MIKIDFPEPSITSWSRWRGRCDSKTAELIEAVAAGAEWDITALYREQKRVYFDPQGPFHGKCAYCEIVIRPGQPGSIEHFRPKKKVTDENHVPVLITDADGCQREHPGYYWLAYDWTNFLPACTNCNSLNSGPTGRVFGKQNCFPVEGTHAWRPGEEDSESPLLVNPVVDDPADHLAIDDTCIFSSRNGSKRGEMCIKVFGLNEREGLLEARRTAYREAAGKVFLLAAALHNHNTADQVTFLKEISDIKEGKSPFSAAGRCALRGEKKLLEPLIHALESEEADNAAD